METRFDLLQQLQGRHDLLVRVLAGLEVSQGGLGPLASVCQAAGSPWLFAGQAKFEEEALALYKKDPVKARELLTKYCAEQADGAVAAYWKLGDELWHKYSGAF